MKGRRAGVILPIFSLPGDDAIGTIADGISFVPLLKKSGLRCWQLLPIGPTIIGDSPFQGPSVFAGNPNLISLAPLVRTGELPQAALKRYQQEFARFCRRHKDPTSSNVRYEFLWQCKVGFDHDTWGYKHGPLRSAFYNFTNSKTSSRYRDYRKFIERCGAEWLDDYAIFMALKAAYGFPRQWSSWPSLDRFRLAGYGKRACPEDVEFHKYVQFVFDEQMCALQKQAALTDIELIGDIPMYPAYDSADVWASPQLFQLDRELKATHVACVPPDNFNPKGGQLWGNPLYKWGVVGSRRIHQQLYKWWEKRLRRLFEYHDLVKIDHFRGFVAYGRVSARAKTARHARWTGGPGSEVLRYVGRRQGKLSIIAEDLGVITEPVKRTLHQLALPGMRLLQFSDFQFPDSHHHPHCAPVNSVAYTGTHDNPTLLEWLKDYCDPGKRRQVESYLKAHSAESRTIWRAIDSVFRSSAARAIVPMQDILELGGQARMNFPSRTGYWRWRMNSASLRRFKQAMATLHRLTRSSSRVKK